MIGIKNPVTSQAFAGRWIGLPASGGTHFLLDTGTLCVLSEYHGTAAIQRWNVPIAAADRQQGVRHSACA